MEERRHNGSLKGRRHVALTTPGTCTSFQHAHLAAAVALDAQEPRREGTEQPGQGHTAELIPTLTAKWLLFDFGRRASADQAARANSFVANVAFTGAHQKLVYVVSRDYFALGAARGRLHVAQQALKTAEIVQDAAETKAVHGLIALCTTPALAAELTLQPIRRYRFDVAILFSDLPLVLWASRPARPSGEQDADVARPQRRLGGRQVVSHHCSSR